ncbi:MAG: hypothetical protein JWP66_781 [Naasia sp.]|nr:hypothetical protein [Naasia sp.]
MTLALDHRVKVLLGALVMIALLAGGWFLGVQPALAAAFDATGQQSEVRTQNEALGAKLAALEAAQADLPELEKRLATLDASVPAGDAQAALLDSIDGLAAAAGVTVSRVAVEAALPYSAPGAAADETEDTAPAAATLMPHTDARITADNLVAMPVTVEVTGSLDAALGFLDGVQSGPRLFLVNKVSSVADSANGGSGDAVTATVAGYVYVLLAAAPAAA